MHAARRVGRGMVAACVLALGCESAPPEGTAPTPTAVVATTTPTATATAVVSPTITAPPPRSPSPSSVAIRTAVAAEAAAPPPAPAPENDGAGAEAPAGTGTAPSGPQPAAPYAAIPTAQPVAPRAPRAFRTPERAGDQAFVPPQGDAAQGGEDPGVATEPMGAPNPGPHGGSGLMILRATARAALQGFDVRISYPRSLGRFNARNNDADCTGPAGAFVQANDRGAGELVVVVASAGPLPFPVDVFCRFATEPHARLSAANFESRVAEVTLDGKKSDPALLSVDVVVR